MSAHDPISALALRQQLAALAARAQRRLVFAAWLKNLRRLAWLPWLALPLIFLLHRAVPPAAIAGGVIMLWMLSAFFQAWQNRPAPYAALALWDAAGRRQEALSSALVFAQETHARAAGDAASIDPGRALHMQRSQALAAAAARQLRADLPLPWPRWTWLGPIAAVAFALLPFWTPDIAAGDRPLTDDMIAAAKAEAEKLAANTDAPPDALKELTDEERRALEELQKKQQELAGQLKNAEGKTPREILDELEKQARAAEELARELGADKDAWASEPLLAELRQHPDTADLADAVTDKNASRAAQESRNLADKLQDPALTSEVSERMRQALENAARQTTEADKDKLVDKTVAAASQQMNDSQPAAAGDEFEKLADTFARQEQREKAQEQLEQLAEQLRQSGSSIMGQQNGEMQKMAGASGSESQPSAMPDLQPLAQPGEASDSTAMLPAPGLDQNLSPPGEPRGTPIPGTGPPPKDAKPLAAIPGAGPLKDSKPLAAAVPIPGSGKGAIPIPILGAAAGGQGPPGLGGTQAGKGSTALGSKATELKAAAAQGEIAATPNADGETYTQSVQGQPREEATARAAQQTTSEFLRTQEEAFDEKNLPPSRREPVRRYFEAIRKRFGE